MKTLTCDDGSIFGPHKTITEHGAYFLCDGVRVDKHVVGGGGTISDYDDSADKLAKAAEQITELKRQVDAKRDELLFTNVEVTFPGPVQKVIQYRGEKDHRALQAVVTGALALSNTPGATVKFRTADNITNIVGASDFVQIGMGVLNQKQALYEVAWAKKDYLDGLDPESPDFQQTLLDFDVDAGWD